jgi:hypothetical protein
VEREKLIEGWYSRSELSLLAACCSLAQDGTCDSDIFLEVGVYKGRSARILDENRDGRDLWLVDTFAMETANTDTWPPPHYGCHHFFRDPLDIEFPPVALFHQDADHSYEVVLDHLEHIGPKVVENGIIVLHDYEDPTYPGVKRAWEIYSENEDFQPYGRRGHLAVFRRTK